MKKQTSQLEKISHSINGAIEFTDFSRSYIFDAIRKNQIKTFKRGNCRFILHEDLVEFIHSLAEEGGV